MLKTLKALQPRERILLLAAAVDHLVPKPTLESDQAPSWPPAELVDELIAETRKASKDALQVHPANVNRYLLHVFTEEMAQQLLPRAEERPARERLGTLGGLQLRSYRVRFGDDFEEEAKRTGVTKGEVLKAIESPDAFEHLPVMGDDPNNLVSLLAKTRNGGKERNAYTLLVEATRQKDTLLVANAWRVFHADVDFASVRTPLELLAAFLAVFGKRFSLGNRAPTQLVEREAIPLHSLGLESLRWEDFASGLTGVESPGRPAPFRLLDRRPDEEVHWSSHMRISQLGVLEVQLFYIVNVTSYIAALRSHGGLR